MRTSHVLLLPLVLAIACDDKPKPAPVTTTTPVPETSVAPVVAKEAQVEIDETLLPAFGVLPDNMAATDNPLTDEKIALGRSLYYETRLSVANDVSCNTCHLLDKGGVDGLKTSLGHKKQTGKRNAPTVYNAAGHIAQFWDGRAKTVEDQAKGPITNPLEMAMPDEKAAVAALAKVKTYQEQFKKAFPTDKEPISMNNIARAIGAFERKLVTPSRWDAFQKGEKSALTAAEKAGFKKFTDVGCNSCHTGVYVGGGLFKKLGEVKPWTSDADVGRFEVTKQDVDKMVFKVPSLRNIEKTGPYFHDGSVATLEEAVKLMARHQLGKELAEGDIASIVAFLKSLTGAVPNAYIAREADAGVK